MDPAILLLILLLTGLGVYCLIVALIAWLCNRERNRANLNDGDLHPTTGGSHARQLTVTHDIPVLEALAVPASTANTAAVVGVDSGTTEEQAAACVVILPDGQTDKPAFMLGVKQ